MVGGWPNGFKHRRKLQDQNDQDLFYAFYREGRSHAALAAELGTTPKGVEARLYRMRSKLRSAVQETGEPRL
jgi:DNA-directed RNA polymerase specialized sigma24 family protein